MCTQNLVKFQILKISSDSPKVFNVLLGSHLPIINIELVFDMFVTASNAIAGA